MQRFSTLLLGLTLHSSIALGKDSPEALGLITFDCFQQNNLDSFYRLIPSITEIAEFGTTIGLDTTSDQYRQFVGRYPLAISNFKEKCTRLLKDTTDSNFTWTLAKLEKVQKSQKVIPIDNRDPNSKTVTITMIDIYFFSNDKRFKLTLGDANCYSGIWKPGNKIHITKL